MVRRDEKNAAKNAPEVGQKNWDRIDRSQRLFFRQYGRGTGRIFRNLREYRRVPCGRQETSAETQE